MFQRRYVLIAMLIAVVAGIGVLVSQIGGNGSSVVAREAEQENDGLAVRPDGGPRIGVVRHVPLILAPARVRRPPKAGSSPRIGPSVPISDEILSGSEAFRRLGETPPVTGSRD